MTKDELIELINHTVYENEDGDITGEVMNLVLNAIVATIGVEANPEDEATGTLNKIKIGEEVFDVEGGGGTVDPYPTEGSTNAVQSGGVKTALDSKQDTLVSGTSIKTVNNTSLLGSGNIQINDGVGFQTITTQQDGAMQITLTNGDTITIDLNHTHEDKQDLLVSGTNIKTINNESLLGSGNITIQGGGGDVNVIEVVKVNGTALTPDQNKAVDVNAVTNITMNNISQTVSNGVVNLGTVITSLSGYVKYEFVNSLPASPQSDTLYLIPVS